MARKKRFTQFAHTPARRVRAECVSYTIADKDTYDAFKDTDTPYELPTTVFRKAGRVAAPKTPTRRPTIVRESKKEYTNRILMSLPTIHQEEG